ncbi:MAG: endo-1,4-beta-xylanase [Armatimonadetes bacterium]|nr:endo-1,4-beta-xylanase [Armatimonadota bacterium]MDW8121417.1 endo-1,4-beta-xylanase [Armatimonadota bacterium]
MGEKDDGSQEVLRQAEEGIEQHRKADGIIELCFPDGSPAPDIPVKVTLQRHYFLFGCPLRPKHYTDPEHLDLCKQLFNSVQLLEFNWGQYEPDEGKPLREERRRFIFDWCYPNNIRNFYGHMLVWTRQYGQYPKTALPLWLFRYDRKTQYELLMKRIQREVQDYRDINIVWDVVNEPIHCRSWGEWEKPEDFDESLDAVFPYVADALTIAHQSNPKAPLLVNEYDLFVNENARYRFRKLVEMLLEKRVPLHAVGIQAHDWRATYWPSPTEIWAVCEDFGSRLGLNIYFTEFCYTSDPSRTIRGRYRSGFWNPETQAMAIEEFYRVIFGHSKVAGIFYFGLVGAEIWERHTGLRGENNEPKPAWGRLRRLLTEEWSVKAEGRTAQDGRFRFRGFFGDYLLEATYQGRLHTFPIRLQPNQENRFSFALGR